MYGQWSWLLITTTNIHNSTIIINQLKSLNFGLDADIVLAKKYSEDIPVTKNVRLRTELLNRPKSVPIFLLGFAQLC